MNAGNLMIARKDGQQVWIGDACVTVHVSSGRGKQCKLQITAPEHVKIIRGELAAKPIEKIDVYYCSKKDRWYCKVNGISEPLIKHYDMIGAHDYTKLEDAVIAVAYNNGLTLEPGDICVSLNDMHSFWTLG